MMIQCLVYLKPRKQLSDLGSRLFQELKGETGSEEPVHVLAYYSVCRPSRIEESVKLILGTRNGCFLSAKSIVSKLNKLKLSLKWEHMTKIAGTGVAPERLHVACALVEAGHVENLRLAFSRYLYDGGPAYSRESEQNAEEAVELIFEAGGVAVLAHPWALKPQVAVIRRLTKPGLHGIDTCRSDGKLAGTSFILCCLHLLSFSSIGFPKLIAHICNFFKEDFHFEYNNTTYSL